MEDRKATVLAAAVGCAAVGGFWLARPSAAKSTIKVVEQIAMPQGGPGSDRDAVMAYRVQMPPPIREAMEDGQPIVLRIADQIGNVYPLVPMSDPRYSGLLKLVRGYATPLQGPRIEAVVNDAVLASAPVDAPPAPLRAPLSIKPDPRIAAVYRGYGWLEAQSRVPLAKDERWHVEARRTLFTDLVDTAADLPVFSSRWRTERLLVPYPEQAGGIELNVTRFRLVERSVTVEIPGLRIEPRLGGTALIVDKTVDVPTSLGTTIRVPRQMSGPRRQIRHGNTRIASGNLLLVSESDPMTEAERRARARRGFGMRLEILSPSPEALGLRELRLGTASRGTVLVPNGPLRSRSFTAVVRFTSIAPVLIDRFTATVPVTKGPPIEGFPTGP